ncbi:hypothetical protein [Janthinobacterium sp. P210006]|uniref:hypothetical protein n=1 Tax=Janthinobacterium sp. P210006 TaxID=3112939 RepID=UPI002E25B981|nr:hypothetical protein [Janthinobacterium sp. P210006]
MRTHELSRYLEQLARLLRKLPDTELDQKKMSFLQDFLPGMAPVKKKMVRSLPIDIQDRLATMSPAEIEDFLLSEDEEFTVGNLSELAERIGLASSKRQSKNALVNMIARHYEALRMHSIMRNSGPTNT